MPSRTIKKAFYALKLQGLTNTKKHYAHNKGCSAPVRKPIKKGGL